MGLDQRAVLLATVERVEQLVPEDGPAVGQRERGEHVEIVDALVGTAVAERSYGWVFGLDLLGRHAGEQQPRDDPDVPISVCGLQEDVMHRLRDIVCWVAAPTTGLGVARQHGAKEVILGSAVPVDQAEVHAGGCGDLAQRRRGALRGELLARCLEDGFADLVTARWSGSLSRRHTAAKVGGLTAAGYREHCAHLAVGREA
jgi:hypothetical protein